MSLNRKLILCSRHAPDRMKWMFVWLAVIVFGGSMVPEMRAANVRSKPADDPAQRLFAQHCQKCHSGAKPKGDFQIEQLSADFADRKNRDQWLKVLEEIRDGKMPPKDKPRPPAKNVRAAVTWISEHAGTAELARRTAEGRVVLRRLNRA